MEVSLAGGARLGLRFGPEPLAELCQVNPEAMLALDYGDTGRLLRGCRHGPP